MRNSGWKYFLATLLAILFWWLLSVLFISLIEQFSLYILPHSKNNCWLHLFNRCLQAISSDALASSIAQILSISIFVYLFKRIEAKRAVQQSTKAFFFSAIFEEVSKLGDIIRYVEDKHQNSHNKTEAKNEISKITKQYRTMIKLIKDFDNKNLQVNKLSENSLFKDLVKSYQYNEIDSEQKEVSPFIDFSSSNLKTQLLRDGIYTKILYFRAYIKELEAEVNN